MICPFGMSRGYWRHSLLVLNSCYIIRDIEGTGLARPSFFYQPAGMVLWFLVYK